MAKTGQKWIQLCRKKKFLKFKNEAKVLEKK